MSRPTCAALLAIATCVLLQACDVSLHWRTDSGRACLQQHRQDVLCLAWAQAVETPARAG
ncbi:hypothetical protein [Stenotrophomonas tuberculopleuritidis]|jgi:hypothetical protein|uniref:hypothetical protein n=1 Tax=Stenotrophomonas tuberculopleuritidis TaxID=3055079 RepID=UPI0026E5167F|nr:hypothetical protein [Stenotrophomonas sp. 704A1]